MANNLVNFLKSEVANNRLCNPLPPIQAGVGSVSNAVLECLKDSDYALYERYMNANTEDEISDIIDYVTERFTTLFQDTKYNP